MVKGCYNTRASGLADIAEAHRVVWPVPAHALNHGKTGHSYYFWLKKTIPADEISIIL
jgi:hypothetical protein